MAQRRWTPGAGRDSLTFVTGQSPPLASKTLQQDLLGPIDVKGPYDDRAATPRIAGRMSIGSLVTCAPGFWVETSHLDYAWSNGAGRVGRNSATYRIQRSDRDHQLRCSVTGTGRDLDLTLRLAKRRVG